jgi:hypothetical protein
MAQKPNAAIKVTGSKMNAACQKKVGAGRAALGGAAAGSSRSGWRFRCPTFIAYSLSQTLAAVVTNLQNLVRWQATTDYRFTTGKRLSSLRCVNRFAQVRCVSR